MDLFLVRHAIAEPYDPSKSDGERALTAAGRARFRSIALELRQLGITFDRVLHSPLLRAVQTAEELEDLCTGEMCETDLLATSPSVQLLAEFEGAESLAVVGHEPWMGDTASLLLSGDSTTVSIAFKKGAVMWLRGTPRPGKMQLAAYLPPRALVGPK